MSVVNDMLRDLEKRKAPERHEFSGSSPAPESMIEPQKSVAVNKFFVALVVCILIAMIAYRVIGESDSKEVVILPTATSDMRADQMKPNSLDQDEKALGQPEVQVEKNAQASAEQKPAIAPDARDSSIQLETNVVTKKNVASNKKANDRSKGSKSEPEQVEKVVAKAQTQTQIKHSGEELNSKALKSTPVPVNLTKTDNKIAENHRTSQSKLVSASNSSEQAREKKAKQIETTNKQAEVSTPVDSGPRVEKENFKLMLSPEARDEQTAESAKKLFLQGRSREAFSLLESFVAANQLVSVSEALLAQAYLQDRKVDEFLSLLDKAEKPLSSGLRQSKARWMMASNDVEGAVKLLQTNPPGIEKSPDHYALLASAYQKLGQHGKAFEAYSELIQFNDEIADWWAGLGLSADQLGQARQAKVAYQQALSMKGLNITLAEYIRQRLRAPEMTR